MRGSMKHGRTAYNSARPVSENLTEFHKSVNMVYRLDVKKQHKRSDVNCRIC